jgi:hypothetical protein
VSERSQRRPDQRLAFRIVASPGGGPGRQGRRRSASWTATTRSRDAANSAACRSICCRRSDSSSASWRLRAAAAGDVSE